MAKIIEGRKYITIEENDIEYELTSAPIGSVWLEKKRDED